MALTAKTGWTEQYIRWHLPLSRGYAYLHAAAISDGQYTCWSGTPDPVEDWIEEVREWAAKISAETTSPPLA